MEKCLRQEAKVLRVPNIISSAIGRVMAAIASVVSAVVSFALVGIIAVVVVLLLLSFLLNPLYVNHFTFRFYGARGGDH